MPSKLKNPSQISRILLVLMLTCGFFLTPSLEVKSQLTHELEPKERVWAKANAAYEK
jgi:hypothetical protein